MGRLTLDQRNRAIGMLQAGRKQDFVAQYFNCSQSTISRLSEKFRATQSVKDLPRPGQPRKTDVRTDRWIVTKVLRNRKVTANTIQAELRTRMNVNVSSRLVRNRLKAAGLKSRRPFKGIVLTDAHRRTRLRWARRLQRRTLARWQQVLFSDESRFSLDGPDGRVRVWRRVNERLANACIDEHDRFAGGGSVMVWGGISGRYKTDLIVINGSLNSRKYRDDILDHVVRPFMQAHPGVVEFQHDGATPHTAHICRQYLQTNNISVLDWPSKSPDLSPIENLWDYLGQHVRDQQNPPQTVAALAAALRQEWRAIPQQYIRGLFNSMRRRLTACIRAQGGHTGY